MTPAEQALAHILIRDAAESLELAIGWVCMVRHDEHPEFPPTVWGVFTEAAAALEFASIRERELNQEGEDGFRVLALPVLPASLD